MKIEETVIKRETYLNKLISSRHNGFIKIITGIRRCGKSYLLTILFSSWLKENGVDEAISYRSMDRATWGATLA
ncbi:MAG: AAA family ATPase [Muribaculaceae bacterium]|nr:AAA family ATPase [Muribaculaceae bacterium]